MVNKEDVCISDFILRPWPESITEDDRLAVEAYRKQGKTPVGAIAQVIVDETLKMEKEERTLVASELLQSGPDFNAPAFKKRIGEWNWYKKVADAFINAEEFIRSGRPLQDLEDDEEVDGVKFGVGKLIELVAEVEGRDSAAEVAAAINSIELNWFFEHAQMMSLLKSSADLTEFAQCVVDHFDQKADDFYGRVALEKGKLRFCNLLAAIR